MTQLQPGCLCGGIANQPAQVIADDQPLYLPIVVVEQVLAADARVVPRGFEEIER